MALRYKIKPPGAAWSPEQTFFDASIKNSYPTLIEIAPGEFRAVWDSGDSKRTRRSIRFGKFSLLKPPKAASGKDESSSACSRITCCGISLSGLEPLTEDQQRKKPSKPKFKR
jgi:hypothetical protein